MQKLVDWLNVNFGVGFWKMKKKIYSDYIIQKDSSGLKKYIADYEGMYKNCDDPHYQSNIDKLEFDFVVQIAKKFGVCLTFTLL